MTYLQDAVLGADMDNFLENGIMYAFYKYALTQVEGQEIIGGLKGWRWKLAKILFNYYTDIPWLLKRKGYSRRTTGGGAGVIRLFLSMKDRNIPPWLNTAMEELIIENGRVIGVKATRDGKQINIKASKGVLLAAGGFENNQQMREQYLPKPTNVKWSTGCRTNTGDAIRAEQEAGANTRLLENAWWCTTKVIPGAKYPYLSSCHKIT